MNGLITPDILLVEDNPLDAELTVTALEKYKLKNRIIHVKDGEEALDYIFGKGQFKDRNVAELPKVILLDLKLPKVDGMEVLKIIKNDDKTKYIPVVVLTSSAEEKDIIDSYKLGVNSYIVKPVDFEKFSRSVAEMGYYWVFLNQPPTGSH
jgi:CheY-like chemotaxis protein